MKSYKEKGIWWSPQEPKIKLNGELSFNMKEGITLNLDGVLTTTDGFEIEIINGQTKNGDDITLYKCLTRKQTFSTSLHRGESTVGANLLFIGHLYNSKPTFSSLNMRTTSLDEWVNTSGFLINPLPKNKIIKVSYELPENIEVYKGEDFSINISTRFKTPIITFPQKRIEMTQKSYLEINFNKELDYLEALKLIYQLQIFLSLAVNEPVFLLEAYGKHISRENQYKKVTIKYKPSSELIDKEVMPDDMLFTYTDIEESIHNKFHSFFTSYKKLEPIFELYSSDIYNLNKSTVAKFMSLIQAIEAYHRRTSSEIDLPEEKHEHRISKILSTVPSEYKEWIESRLKYSNEISLRRRLKLLYDKYDYILLTYIKKKKLVNYTLNTRNYHTHYDSSLENSIAKDKKLFYLNIYLRILLLTILLDEIGFTKEEIINISSKYKYRFLKTRI